jgi:hypothetical protein
MTTTIEPTRANEVNVGVPSGVNQASLAEVGTDLPAGDTSTSPETGAQFQKGVAISMWQNSGGEHSNWGQFVDSRGKCCGLIPNIMDRSSPNDGACGFWERCVQVYWAACCCKVGVCGCVVTSGSSTASQGSCRHAVSVWMTLPTCSMRTPFRRVFLQHFGFIPLHYV